MQALVRAFGAVGARLFSFVLLLSLLGVLPVQAEVAHAAQDLAIPTIVVGSAQGDMKLRSQWQYSYAKNIQAIEHINPDAVWHSTAFKNTDQTGWMDLHADRHYLARFRLNKVVGDDGSFIVVPSPQVDKVMLWWRASDGSTPWRAAESGDTVPVADRAMHTPYPTFLLPGALSQIDVVMAFENQEGLFMQAYMQNNFDYQVSRSLYSNGTGASLGLLGAVSALCLLAWLWLRRAEFFWLMVLGVSSFFMYMGRNGVGGSSVWSDALAFNNMAMVFFGFIACGSLLMTVSYLLASFKGIRLTRQVYWVAAAVAFVCSVLTLVLWSFPTAKIVFRSFTNVILLLGMIIPSLLAFAKGDRIASWVSFAIMAIVVSGAALIYSYYRVDPGDVWGIVSAVAWAIAILGLFAAAYGKFQYGFTALGDRLHVNDHVDQLTGMQNSKGYTQSVSLAALAAGQRRDFSPVFTVLMCRLPAIENQESEEFGKTVSNQVEVRLAASLKQALPETSNIARVQRGCFAAFITDRINAKLMEGAATKVISDVLNAEDLPNFVSELGLQILIGQIPGHRLSPAVFQALHAFGEAQEGSNKTIHWVDLSVSSRARTTR